MTGLPSLLTVAVNRPAAPAPGTPATVTVYPSTVAVGTATGAASPGTVTGRLSTSAVPLPGPLSGVNEAYTRQFPGARAESGAVQVPSAANSGCRCWKPVRSARTA